VTLTLSVDARIWITLVNLAFTVCSRVARLAVTDVVVQLVLASTMHARV